MRLCAVDRAGGDGIAAALENTYHLSMREELFYRWLERAVGDKQQTERMQCF